VPHLSNKLYKLNMFYLKTLILAVATICFVGPLLADEDSNIQLLTKASGALLRVEFTHLDDLTKMVEKGDPLLELTDAKSGKRYGYFLTEVKVLRSYANKDKVPVLERMKILVPAAKIIDHWVLINSTLKYKDGIILVDGMELGFANYICLKMFVKFDSSINEKLERVQCYGPN